MKPADGPALPSRWPFKVYRVGGVVRDQLLGQPPGDCDWVVVGATPQALLDAGFTPVGKDFPVFLHPQTHEEYALARTERKSAPGYHGFTFHADPGVTLEADLARRDLTINAIAQDPATGELIDPYGGVEDVRRGLFRHVSPAFAEDPVRLLRVARLSARFTTFDVAPDTMDLLRAMVQAGEVDALVPERVWQELSRGLIAAQPPRMWALLRACGALARLCPELDRLWGVPQPAEHHPEIDTGVHVMMVLQVAADMNAPLPVRYACLCHDLGKGTTPSHVLPRHLGHEGRSVQLARQVSERWRVPNECRELAELVAREHGNIHRALSLSATALLRLYERCDALRRPERFLQALQACECDARGRAGHRDAPYPQADHLARGLAVLQATPVQAVAQAAQATGVKGPALGRHIASVRAQALAQALNLPLMGGAADASEPVADGPAQ